ncbi:MAG: hypothetical protein RLO50_05145 [Azospirillaceae bacterium]
MTKRNRIAARTVAALTTFALGAAIAVATLTTIAGEAQAQVAGGPPDRRTDPAPVSESYERDHCGALAIEHLGYSDRFGHVFEMTNDSNSTASVFAVVNSSVRQQFWVPNGAVLTVALGQGQLIETLDFASDRCETQVEFAQGNAAPFDGAISIPPLFM